jgi:hypothetical protein
MSKPKKSKAPAPAIGKLAVGSAPKKRTKAQIAADDAAQADTGPKERNGYKLGMKPPEHVLLYWDKRDGSYWHRLNGAFIAMGKSDLSMQMKGLDLSDWFIFDGQREMDWPLWRAQMERMVDYAGPMAGHRVGVFTDGGQRSFLVTNEPHGIFTDETLLKIIKQNEDTQ